jgi:hypothetical protein
LDAPQGLERIDHWGEPPRLHLGFKFLREPLEAFGVCANGAHICLADDLLRWGGTDHRTAPPERGWAPGGPARIADILPQEQRFEAKFGRLEVADDLFPRPTQVPHGLIFNLWNGDGGQGPRAQQSGQCDGIAAVGFDPIPRLCGDEGWGHHPADLAFCRERAREPIPTRPCFIDKDEVRAFGLQPADECIDIALARPDVSQGDDVGVMALGDVGHGYRRFVDIQSDRDRGRLVQG